MVKQLLTANVGKELLFKFQYPTNMNDNSVNIKVALADDHILLRNALASLINNFGNCKVIHESSNGKEFIDYLKKGCLPDVAIIDLNMPEMDGFETAKFLQKSFSTIHVLML